MEPEPQRNCQGKQFICVSTVPPNCFLSEVDREQCDVSKEKTVLMGLGEPNTHGQGFPLWKKCHEP